MDYWGLQLTRHNYFITGNIYPLLLNESFLDFANKFGLSQIITFPTRGNNILDIFLTNHPSAVDHCDILLGISDHHIVIVKSSISVFHSIHLQGKSTYGTEWTVLRLKCFLLTLIDTF